MKRCLFFVASFVLQNQNFVQILEIFERTCVLVSVPFRNSGCMLYVVVLIKEEKK